MSSRSMDDQVRKIFVGGLDYNTVETTLEQYFGQWGPVSECTIKRFPDGNSRGFGFVTFSSLAAMENCFESQPHMIDGKNVDLRKATENLSKAGPDIRSKVYNPESRELKKLFVGSLDFSTTEDEIKEYFLQFGEIVTVTISKYPDSGRSRGFAFVTFQSATSVDQVQQARPHIMKGRKLETKRATPKHLVGKPESQVSTTKIFIGPPEVRGKGHSGLSEEISDEDLETYFGQFGTIVKVQQMRWDDSGKKRGYGYVEFTEEDAVDKAVLVRNHVIKDREIEAKKSLTKQQMKDIQDIKNSTASSQGRNFMGGSDGGMGMNNMGMSNMGMSMNNMGMGNVGMGMGMNTGGMGMNNMHQGMNNSGFMGMGMTGMSGMNNGSMGMGMNTMGSGNMNKAGFNFSLNPQRGIKRPRAAVDPEAKIMRKLYVGNMAGNTTENDLQNHFEQYGEIEEVYLHKLNDTGRSPAFAFVTFVNSSGVDNVQMSRPHVLKGNTLETKRALPKGENGVQEDVRVKKVFIGAPEDEKHSGGHSGLSEEIEDEDLNNYFSQFGVVLKIEQLRWKDSGKKRGYGYIEFDDEDAVDKVCLLGIHEVLGVRLEVKKAVEKHSQQNSSGSEGFLDAKRSRKELVDPESKIMRKIFIGNLNPSTSQETLKEYFEQFGPTEIIQLPLHADSGKSRGFAFITFEKASSVDATQAARPHRLDGSVIETTRATPKQNLGNPEAEAKVKKIFIGGPSDEKSAGHSGLTEDISDNDLEEYFGKFGTVTKVDQKIWEDTGKKRGYGYIEFDDEDTADKIVLLGVHVVKGVRLETRKGLNKEQLKNKAAGGMKTSSRMGQMGSVGMGLNNMDGNMQTNMQHFNDNNMGNMMGRMQSMMGSMSSGNMDTNNMMGNMQKMQKMMGEMQNMKAGGMGPSNSMQMMQNMMNMQNMMGNMQKNQGNSSDQNMAMMSTMQQMMMNMMSMCTQMMNQNMSNMSNNSPSSTSNNSSLQNRSGSNQGNRGLPSMQGSSGFNQTGNTQGKGRYQTSSIGQGSYNYGTLNSGYEMGYGSSSSTNQTQQGNMGYSTMGNTMRGGGPLRGDMTTNRGNPYSRN